MSVVPDNGLKFLYFLLGEAENVLPLVRGEYQAGVMEAVLFVGLFDIDLDAAVLAHFGMDYLGIVVKGKIGVHHINFYAFAMQRHPFWQFLPVLLAKLPRRPRQRHKSAV